MPIYSTREESLINIGTVITGSAGSSATVTNVGTSTEAILNFTIPRGTDGVSSGSVTSVGLSLPSLFSVTNSPITTTGSLTATLASQTANTAFLAPNGSNGTPTFRALASADIPNLDAAKITSGTIGTARLGSGTANSTTYLRGDGSWATVASGGSGTVTSVGLNLPALFNVSGSPVTSTGTLTATFANQAANQAFLSPDGSLGTPSFRGLVSNDIPNLAASKITSGVFTVARLGTGIPDGTKFLRDDGSFVTPPGSGSMEPAWL